MHSDSDQVLKRLGLQSLNQVLETASEILAQKYLRQQQINDAKASQEFLRIKLGKHDSEVFAVMFLDSQHRLIEYREMFFGTIHQTSVYPRTIAKLALELNAAAVILAHNHPSGVAEPSQADIRITERLREALGLLDVTVLDHIVVGETSVSLAERGLI